MAIAFVKNGGTAAVKASQASLSVTVPAGGHAAGNLVVVAIASELSGTDTTDRVVDTRGNTYTKIDAGNTAASRLYRAVLFGSVLTTALQAGDTITADMTSTGAPAKFAIATAEFSGVTITEDVASTFQYNAAAVATPSAGPITPISVATLMIGAFHISGPTGDAFTEDSDSVGGDTWHAGPIAGTTGGSATGNVVARFSYKITISAAAQTYNPTLGTARSNTIIIASLQAAVTGPAPQTKAVTGLVSPQAFGAIATAKGPVSRTMAGLVSPQAFGTAVAKATFLLPVGTVTSAQAFGSVTVWTVTRPSAVGVISAQSFGAVTTAQGAVSRTVIGPGSAQGFGAITATSTGGVQTQPVTGVSSAQAFGSSAPSARVTVQVGGKASSQQFGTFVFATVVTRTVTGLGTAQEFGAATVKAAITRAVGAVASVQAFGTIIVQTVTRPAAGGVSTAQVFGAVTPSTRITRQVGSVGSAQSFGVVSPKATRIVTVGGVSSAQAFSPVGIPQLVQVPGVLPPGAVYLTSITGLVIVGDGHVVGSGWSYAAQFGTPHAVIGSVFPSTVPANGIDAAWSFGTVTTVKGSVARAVTGVGSAQQFGAVTVVKGAAVGQAVGVTSAQAFGSVTIKTARALTVIGVGSAQSFGALSFATTGGPQTKAVGPVFTAQAFGLLTIRTAITRQVGQVASAQAFGSLAFRVTLGSGGVLTAQAFGAPVATAIGLEQTIQVPGVSFATVTYTAITGLVICGTGWTVGSRTVSTQFGAPRVIYTPQTVIVPGVTRPPILYSVTGGVICGDGHVVGWNNPLFGQPWIAFSQILPLSDGLGVPSAQRFGTVTLKPGPVWIPVVGLGSAQAFGKPDVFIVWIHPFPCTDLDLELADPDLDLILALAACADISLALTGSTDLDLDGSPSTEIELQPLVIH